MSPSSHELLAAFDALPPDEQRQVAVAILRGTIGVDDLSDAGLNELGAELFRAYDAEE